MLVFPELYVPCGHPVTVPLFPGFVLLLPGFVLLFPAFVLLTQALSDTKPPEPSVFWT